MSYLCGTALNARAGRRVNPDKSSDKRGVADSTHRPAAPRGLPEDLGDPAVPIVEDPLHLAPRQKRVHQPPERPERQPIAHHVDHPRPPVVRFKSVRVMPEPIRTAQLHIHKLRRRIPSPNQGGALRRHAPAAPAHVGCPLRRQARRASFGIPTVRARPAGALHQRGVPTHGNSAHFELVADLRAGCYADGAGSESSKSQPRPSDCFEIAGVGEKREDLIARPRNLLFAPQRVKLHGRGRAGNAQHSGRQTSAGALPSTRSAIISRSIDTNTGCTPTVDARDKLTPNSRHNWAASVSRS